MKISYNWLKEFVSIDAYSPGQLAEILLSVGFEVSEISATDWPGIDRIVAAKILEVAKHPNADNLLLCRLTDGQKEYSVVCGAKNVSAGIVVPFALPGSSLPGGMQIKEAVLRGVKSEGMICSSRELGIDDEHSGIMHLAAETAPGRGIKDVFQFDDYVLNVEVPANRGDCLGHLGVAREIATKLGLTMHHLQIHSTEKPGSEFFTVEISSPELCARYIIYVLGELRVGSSSPKIKIRLKNCGLRPINNVVDVTNYVLMEFGHPLHAFDLDKISGQKISVRKARKSESLVALDGKTYNLDTDTLVIADAVKPLAIAGVIGSAESGVTETTKRILLESALFNAAGIRTTRQRLQILTESSYRFERSLSWEICQLSSQRAVRLLAENCSACYVSRTDVRTGEFKRRKISLRPSRVEKVTALKIEKKEIAEILTRLGMTVTPQSEQLSIEVPSWRQDIEEEIDLIEDISRQKGYDKIPFENESRIILSTGADSRGKTEEKIRAVLHSAGFFEALNYSLVPDRSIGVLDRQQAVEIENPISQEYRFLRTNLAGGLLSNVQKNINNQNEDIKLYEFGKVYFSGEGGYAESTRLGLACTGFVVRENWKYMTGKIDFYYLSGIINAILSELGFKVVKTAETSRLAALFHPGKSVAKLIADETDGLALCEFGMVSPGLMKDLSSEVFYAEFFTDNLYEKAKIDAVFKPYSNLPKLKRDLSLTAPEGLSYETILKHIFKTENDEIEVSAVLFDLYQGKNIPKDKKAFGIRLTFSHRNKTLEDREINEKIDRILEQLKILNVSLRNA